LDKFNYNDAVIKLFSLLTILVALITIFLQLPPNMISEESIKRGFSIIIIVGIFFFIRYSYLLKKANAHFIRREEMIDEWYGLLGVNKKVLDVEFLKGYKKPCILF